LLLQLELDQAWFRSRSFSASSLFDGPFFRSRGHDNAPVAQRYRHGLAQAEAATFAAMAAVVEDGCEQPFRHVISNAPWRHEPVIAQIGCLSRSRQCEGFVRISLALYRIGTQIRMGLSE
jgi:hypothetical protein